MAQDAPVQLEGGVPYACAKNHTSRCRSSSTSNMPASLRACLHKAGQSNKPRLRRSEHPLARTSSEQCKVMGQSNSAKQRGARERTSTKQCAGLSTGTDTPVYWSGTPRSLPDCQPAACDGRYVDCTGLATILGM
eukprot:1139858-Pelagomonas_calceolata.AAC.5